MDLFQLMAKDDDLKAKAFERLKGIVALYDADDDAQQDEAMTRAINFCGMEWDGYRPGIEALIAHLEPKPAEAALVARLREEAAQPGAMIQAAREARAAAKRLPPECESVVARYGSLEAALGPTPWEQVFIDSAKPLVKDSGPHAPILGWNDLQSPVCAAIQKALSSECPLPETIADARAEVLTWEDRARELAILATISEGAALPTACLARMGIALAFWRSELPVCNQADFEARLDYWTNRGGDLSGYGVLARDFHRLAEQGGIKPAGAETTKDRCRRLKAANPGWSLARIAQEVGISRQAVHKHLKAL
ncbi:MAG: helix-turn-helix domain-containing protein [Alphaproteobacteria bacterium]|nr:helix-turn-helix domain-containing protein [Alphaproteobacteria bacterium]